MNIFKTLASGSGSINEPNVSAFLGYLLNTKEDHGLGDTFLRKFLEPLLKENNSSGLKGRNLSIRSNFEMEVILEQAFKKDSDSNDDNNSDDSKQIVDIVILCYEKESQQGQFLAEEIIKQKKDGKRDKLKHIFLIENKINDGSVTPKQLENQFKQTIDKLIELDIKNAEELVSVIFVTPEGKNSKEAFSNFDETNNKKRLFWHTNNGDSISKIIREIIKEESQPMDVYCKYTLQAFLEFIESGFKSTIKEELEEKKGERDYTKYDFGDDKNLYKNRLVRAVIAKYVQDNQGCTLSELQRVFPKKLHGSKDCVIDADKAKTPIKNGNTDYYFIKDEELITLENGDKIAVSNWWDKDNLPNFLKKAKELGYTITEQ